MTQEEALSTLKSYKNTFLTGIAGAGKTYVLMQYINYLKEKYLPFAITASTGIVATAIDGTTIHSFSGLGINESLDTEQIEKIKFNGKIAARIAGIAVLIIDEISMLSAEQLDCINRIFQAIYDNPKPFGGIQVVFCGDFLQLPPVKGNYAFTSDTWKSMELQICYLDKAYRQKDSSLLTVLNAIRTDTVDIGIRQLIYERLNRQVENSIKLFTHNQDVDFYNEDELVKINARSYHYYMSYEGDPEITTAIQKNCLSPVDLELKVGARVMVTRNIFEDNLVNGTMAIVKECYSTSVEIQTMDGITTTLKPIKWSRFNRENIPIASIQQIPLRLAYAITVHKSQGMTLDAATMNLSRVFQPGQGYVALSRLRSLDKLALEESVGNATFTVSPECLEYEQEIILLSR